MDGFIERMLDEFSESIENADPEELMAEMEQDMGRWEVQRIAAQTKKVALDAVDKYRAAQPLEDSRKDKP